MANRTRDLLPNQKTAGSTTFKPNESAANCVRPQEIQRASTPEHLKKYRKSYKNSCGQTILHYGTYDDKLPNTDHIYGKKIYGSDHTKDVLESQKQEGIKQMINEIKETRYQSNQVEPLGKGLSRNYVYPPEAQSKDFQFGAKTKENEFTGKQVVFPQNPTYNDEKVQAQYVKTHGNYEAGQQRDRGYNWQSIDPKDHRFGKTEVFVPNQVQSCLNQDSAPEQFPKTRIVQLKQEDFRNYKDDQLGTVKNLAQNHGNIDTNQAFGARLGGPDAWNAGKCISGEGSLKDVKVDSDLGTTNRYGYRNITRKGDENRIFGVPTIRNDIVKTSMRSVADPNNYGDEKPALKLLFPDKYEFMGIDQKDFSQRRLKYEIKDIFEKVGYKYKLGKFEGIFRRALEIDDSVDGKCSVQSFMQAVREMDHEI